MSQLRAGLFWLVLFLAAGFGGGEWARPFLVLWLHNPFWAIWPYAGEAGALVAAVLFVLLAAFQLLPGLGRGRDKAKFGPLQALWLLLGFLFMEFAGYFIFSLAAACFRVLTAGGPGQAPIFDVMGPGATVLAMFAGSFAAFGWCFWFLHRRGPALLRDPRPCGVAWAPAPGRAYAAAAGAALAVVLVVAALFHFLPPDLRELQQLPDQAVFQAPGWVRAGLGLMIVLVAPVVEEFVFRGGIFAALATRLSPLISGAITTLAFVALHSPEKIHYPPGFLDVTLMAAASAWLRVRFGSIRPCILLHMLYNIGVIMVSALAG